MNQIETQDEQFQKQCWITVGILFLILVACYLNMLLATAEVWSMPTYNMSGFIPIVAVILLLIRREPFVAASSQERWFAAGLIVVATGIRIWSSSNQFALIDRLTFLVCLAAVFLFVGGTRALKWSGWPIIFLFLMYPWPRLFVDNIMRPMQTLATMISTFSLQTLGVDAYRDGNRIMLDHAPMNVAEQCSGLRMLTLFIAFGLLIALVSNHRPLWERIVIGSPITTGPIALLVNSIRITVTGLLMNMGFDGEATQELFHDFAGWIMMPMAFGFLFLEMWILGRLVIEEEDQHQSINPGIGQSVV